MRIDEFAMLVTQGEGKKKSVNIAQIKEVLKVSNTCLNGELYKLIRTK